MTYKLKEEYKGLIISKHILGLGNVTLDTNTAKPTSYENYHNMGFNELFDLTPEESPIQPEKKIITEYQGIKNNKKK